MKLPKRMTTKTVGLGYWNKIDEAETERRKKIVAMVRSNGGTARHLANALRITVKHARYIAAKFGMPFGRPTGRAGGRKPKVASPYLISSSAAGRALYGLTGLDETVSYELRRRAMGALPFIARMGVEDRCKWPLEGESGMHMMTCCTKIPYGSTYCDHHRAIGTTPLAGRRLLEAAE
jgi:hypothetical protein